MTENPSTDLPDDEPMLYFGTAAPLLMDDFHLINAATMDWPVATNMDLHALTRTVLAGRQPDPKTVFKLLRRILSDDTVISRLQEDGAALRGRLAELETAVGPGGDEKA